MKVDKIEDNQIEIRIVPSTEYILDGIINRIYVMFEFNISKKEEELVEKRSPLELSIVLDRSGSMHGKKLEYSKIAIEQIINNLRNDDTIHFVMYDSKAEVVFNKGDLSQKEILITKLKAIGPGGMTNLSDGILKGYSMFEKSTYENKRMFVFSDGLANQGIINIADVSKIVNDIKENYVNTSSFGIGRDFDEDMMQAISEHGNGDYFFIEQADKIPDIVSEGIEGLLSTVTSNNEFSVRGVNGGVLKKIYTHDISCAKLGDLKNAETRQILVELEINPSKLKDGNNILEYKLEYNPIDNMLQKKEFKGTFSINLTDDEDKIIDENDEILVLKNLLEAAEYEYMTIKYLDNNEFDDAITNQKKMISKLEKIQNKDKKGVIKDKLEMANNTLDSLIISKNTKNSLRSRKMAAYSRYQTKHSKKRRINDN